MQPLASGDPDEIDVELLRLGGIAHPMIRQRVERAADSTLSEASADMDRYAQIFARHAPGLPAPAPRASWRRWVVPALAAAMALLIAGSLAWQDPAPDGVRSMGGLPVDVAVTRDAGPVPPPVDYRAGDRVHLGFVADRDGYVDVYTVQEDGAVSVLLRGAPVEATRRFVMPGAAKLDAYAGSEWIVIELADAPRQHQRLVEAGRALLPDPALRVGPGRWALEVTRAP